MKALLALVALLGSTTVFASSASVGTVYVTQNNEASHAIIIQGEAAKTLYQDLRAEEIPNNNDVAPGFSKSGQNIVCDVSAEINYSCTLRLNRATGTAL